MATNDSSRDAKERIAKVLEDFELNPAVVEQHTTTYDSMKPANRQALLNWIKNNFEPASRISPFTSYVLRQMFMNQMYAQEGDIFKVSNVQFRAAMLDAGFKPAALEVKAGKAHWRFYLKMDKAQDRYAQTVATQAQSRAAEGTLAMDEQNELDATEAATARDIAGSNANANARSEQVHSQVKDQVQQPSPGTEQSGNAYIVSKE